MITVFNDVKDKIPKYTTLEKVFEAIKSCSIQPQLDLIRAEKDKQKKQELKKQLKCILFAGKFKSRGNNNIDVHNGTCVIDLDHLPDVNATKNEMKLLPFVIAAFISPSGDGLKVVCRIPANIEKHEGHYAALMRSLKLKELDTTSKNIERVCFASADADIYINLKATEFTDYYIPPKKYSTPIVKIKRQFIGADYKRLTIAADMIRGAADGSKLKVLLAAANLMGGYIASGVVDENDAINTLECEIQKRDIDDFDVAKKAIKDAIAYGKTAPLYELERSAGIYVSKKSGLFEPDEIWEGMKSTFIHGKKRGETTYISSLDPHFTWKSGEINLIIGRPNAGKSEFSFQLMLLKAVFDGWKWGVFTPENYPADEFYDTLIHAYIGKTTDPYYGKSQMNLAEYEKGYNFVKKHFFYIYPETHTIEEIDANFNYLIEHEGIKGTLIDPFNQLENESTLRDDKFLSEFLRIRKRRAVEFNLCDIITTHPKNMTRNSKGEYDVPDMYDISGGAMWSNKMDNIIVVNRPLYITDPSNTQVDIHVRKIKKQKLVGIPGVCSLNYSRPSNRYMDNGISPLEKNISVQSTIAIPEPVALKPNISFDTPQQLNPKEEPFQYTTDNVF